MTDNNESWKEYSREYHQKNPVKAKRWRISAAINLLKRNGYGTRTKGKSPGEGAK